MAKEDWHAKHVDIENAFVEADLDKIIYMNLPSCHNVNGLPTKVCLIKSLYGLKQAGKLFFDLLSKNLKNLKCIQLQHDQCVFRHTDAITNVTSFIIVYVDDIIFMGPSELAIDSLVKSLGGTFRKYTVENSISKYIGIELSRNLSTHTAKLTQSMLITDLFASSNIPSRVRNMPMNPSYDYRTLGDGTSPTMHEEARSIRYAGDKTQPQILAHAGLLSRGAHRPSPLHRRGWTHLMQYLDTNKHDGLTLGGHGDIQLFGFADASSFPGSDSKSTLGFTFFLNLFSGAIFSRSKRGTTVDLSSAEAELKAICEAVRQSVWLRGFLSEVGYPQLSPTVIYTDSLSAMFMVEKQHSNNKSNHLVKFYNYVHEAVEQRLVALKYITSDDQVADLLTKPLAAEASSNLTDKILHGLNGVLPTPGSVATPHQIRLKQLTKMRAAKAKQDRVTKAHQPAPPSSVLAASANSAFNRDSRVPQFNFKHNNNVITFGALVPSTCMSCATNGVVTPTCIGYELCGPCLAVDLHMKIAPTRLNECNRQYGLWADNGTPINRLDRNANVEVIPAFEPQVLEYVGERLTYAAMHDRYRRSGPNALNIAGPYCCHRVNGHVIDCAYQRCILSMANHGPREGPVGVRANMELYAFQGQVFARTTEPILNGDQLILHYGDNFPITWYQRNGYSFKTD